MKRKGTILSRLEILILIITLCTGIILILFLTYPSLFSKKTTKPSQPSNIFFENEKKTNLVSDDFIDSISHLTDSQKILNYLKENFVIDEKITFSLLSPKEIFERKKGNSFELAIFTSYVLWYQGYESSIIKYKTKKGRENSVVVFRDKDFPKTIVFNDQEPFSYPHGWSFEEMFIKEEKRLKEEITEYSIFYWSDAGKLLPEKEELIKRKK